MAIKDNLKQWASQTLGREDFTLVHPKDLAHGDYALIVSDKTAEEDFELLNNSKPEYVSNISLAKPRFINILLSLEFFKKSLEEIVEQGESFGRGGHAKGFKVMVEHTQPNPFKTLHIGHLMNNVIGETIARIIKWNGAEVKTASYHGDVGMHVAKAMWAGGDYAKGAKAFEEDPQAKAEIEEINKKIYEKSDSDINARYEAGRKKSLEEFEKIYERLGSKFDYHFFESEAGEIGKKLVLENVGKVFEVSEGATVFTGGSHTRVFLNSQGLPTYEAKEVGLAQIKKGKFPFDLSITVTANEQDGFFKVVEVAIGEVFPELKGKLKHLSHGILKLPTGKMSSRTGAIIPAEVLIEQVKEKAKEQEEVAIAAIKYMILRQSIGSDIIFDFEKSVSTEGDSGVYLQYAHARACSVLEKAGSTPTNPPLGKGEGPEHVSGQAEGVHEIERLLYRFPEIVERAGAEYAPNYIVTYLTELASAFNNFYAHEQIAGNVHRVAITKAFKIVMKNGLNILGIGAPERM